MRRFRARNRAAGLREVRRWASASVSGAVSYSDHRLHDIRSLALHALVAKKLAKDTRLIGVAKRNLARWKKGRPNPLGYLAEWEQLLSRPIPEVLDVLTAMNERATRLRQSSPFAGVLSPKERKRLFDAFRA
jgi:hypothetical protein